MAAFVALAPLDNSELSTISIPTSKMWKLRSREGKFKAPKVTRLEAHGLESPTGQSSEAGGAGRVRPISRRRGRRCPDQKDVEEI